MWLRAVRAAERGQDPGIGIAGKSPPNPVLALDRGLLVSPRRKPVRHTPKVPVEAQVPRATPSALPRGALQPKPLTLPVPLSLGAVAHLFPAPYSRSPRKYSRSLSHAQESDAKTLPTRQLFFS